MSYHVHPSKRARKSIKKLERSGDGEALRALAAVIELLSVYNAPAKFVLREEWKDHSLKGKLKACRELHLGFDLLLIYQVDEYDQAIELHDITTHEELRKRQW